MTQSEEITQLLADWKQGDAQAGERLMEEVYGALRAIARKQVPAMGRGESLQATALVNEAYLRFFGQRYGETKNRSQFYALAAITMRRVLVDHCREKARQKRGGEALKVTLNDVDPGSNPEPMDILALNRALEELAEKEPRQVKLVELRYFAGLSVDETAEVLEVSPRTVKREWRMARAWLFERLTAE